jgi:hypothetical protein
VAVVCVPNCAVFAVVTECSCCKDIRGRTKHYANGID